MESVRTSAGIANIVIMEIVSIIVLENVIMVVKVVNVSATRVFAAVAKPVCMVSVLMTILNVRSVRFAKAESV